MKRIRRSLRGIGRNQTCRLKWNYTRASRSCSPKWVKNYTIDSKKSWKSIKNRWPMKKRSKMARTVMLNLAVKEQKDKMVLKRVSWATICLTRISKKKWSTWRHASSIRKMKSLWNSHTSSRRLRVPDTTKSSRKRLAARTSHRVTTSPSIGRKNPASSGCITLTKSASSDTKPRRRPATSTLLPTFQKIVFAASTWTIMSARSSTSHSMKEIFKAIASSQPIWETDVVSYWWSK